MTGRQIRWASLGRVGAIAAAVLAAIVSVPALLGGERPPPVPGDVGLVARAEPVAPLVSSATQAPAGLASPSSAPRPSKNRLGKGGRVERDQRQHPRHRPSRRHEHRNEGGESVAAAPAYVPAPVYSPPPPGEFRFER